MSMISVCDPPVETSVTERERKIHDYLCRHVGAGTITHEAMGGGLALMRYIKSVTRAIDPDVSVGQSSEVLLSWDRDDHYLAVEMHSGAVSLEWYYRDPTGRDQWTETVGNGAPLSRRVSETLRDHFA